MFAEYADTQRVALDEMFPRHAPHTQQCGVRASGQEQATRKKEKRWEKFLLI